ncbi:MAG: site-2 protease family protein [bacterium]
MIITILALIFVFGLLVFVHELGHFVAAKLVGVEVKTFAFGFPPRIWSKKYKDTVYAINALPLGGYCTLRGQDEENLTASEAVKEQANPKSLASKKPIEVLFILVAGVFMNIMLAIFLLYICYLVGFQPILPDMQNYSNITDSRQVLITGVEKDAPAEKQGLKSGDIIIKVDGIKVANMQEVITLIQKVSDGNKSVSLLVLRANKEQKLNISTYQSKVNSGGKEINVQRIGITLENVGVIRGNIFSSLVAATSQVFKSIGMTFMAIIDLFKNLVLRFQVSDNISGPVGIVVVTNYFASMGFMYVLQFAAILSISLAVFNILPIPGLDGGHILLTLIEVIRGKKIDSRKKNIISLAGFGVLILLIIIITVKDLFTFNIIGMLKGLWK